MELSQLENWYQSLLRIRVFEESLSRLYSREIFRCPIHLAIGHEGSAVGVCTNLSKSDLALSYHRSHHHYLAKGGDALALFNELLGKPNGCSGGRGGSTHLTDLKVGFVASTAIISGLFPVATGLAHSLKMNNKKDVVALFCGDAALEEGVAFESLNLASLWSLPLLVVVEDNDLSCYTDKTTRQSYRDYSKIAELFNFAYEQVDGSDTEAVSKSSELLIKKVRETSRPALLDVKVFRAMEHCGPEQDDLLEYRVVKGQWPEKDPVKNLEARLTQDSIKKIQQQVHEEIEMIFKNSGDQ